MTIDYILSKKIKYNGIIIDTNLLLLLLIGLFDAKQIGKLKRINKYSQADFEKLVLIISHFPNKMVTTTNILTEICNLSDNFNRETKFNFFRFVEEVLKSYKETPEKSVDLIRNDQKGFYKLGIADTSIINLAAQDIVVLTDDLDLYLHLTSRNYDAVNYNHLMAY